MGKRKIMTPIVIGDVAAVPLTNGGVTIIDADDVERVCRYNWYGTVRSKTTRYAYRYFYVRGKAKLVFLHRFIMRVERCQHIDHRNGHGLFNRKGNLRPATKRDNTANSGLRLDNESGHKGVSFSHHTRKPWRARIKRKDGKYLHLGYFENAQDAAAAYASEASNIFGEFARLS